MSAPALWILLPLATSAAMLLFLRRQNLVRGIGIIVSGLLALTAILQPIGNVLHLGSISLDIKPELIILGRSFLLSNSQRFALTLVYVTVFLFLLGMSRRTIPSKFVPLSLAIAATLLAALAVQPFIYSSVLVQLAVLLMVLMVKEKSYQPEQGIFRFLIYLSLAMPCILFSGWIQGGATNVPSDQTRELSVVIFLLVGFSIWMAVFPFHSWLPQFSRSVHPYYFGLLFCLLPIVTLLIIMNYISSLTWLKSATYLVPVLRTVGTIMVVYTGVFAATEKDLKRLLAYTVSMETGFALLMLSLKSQPGLSLLYQSFIPRIVGLALMAYTLSVFLDNGVQLTIQGNAGVLKKLPFATFGLLISMLSISGFPLFAEFPMRLELLQQIVQTSTPTLIWLALGLGGFMIAPIRIFIHFASSDQANWQINEKISQVVIISIGAILLILMGGFPQLTAGMLSPFSTDLMILW